MANRKAPPPPQVPNHTVPQLRRYIERIQRCITELEAFNPNAVTERFGDPEVNRLQTAIDEVLSAAFGHDTPSYYRYCSARQLDNGPISMRSEWYGGGDDGREVLEAREYLAKGKTQSITLLNQAITSLKDQIADQDGAGSRQRRRTPLQSMPRSEA